MSNYTRTSSRPNTWVRPRAHTDAGLRLHHYGRIEPMDDECRAQWRKDLWLVPLVAGLGIAVTLAFVAVGGAA